MKRKFDTHLPPLCHIRVTRWTLVLIYFSQRKHIPSWGPRERNRGLNTRKFQPEDEYQARTRTQYWNLSFPDVEKTPYSYWHVQAEIKRLTEPCAERISTQHAVSSSSNDKARQTNIFFFPCGSHIFRRGHVIPFRFFYKNPNTVRRSCKEFRQINQVFPRSPIVIRKWLHTNQF